MSHDCPKSQHYLNTYHPELEGKEPKLEPFFEASGKDPSRKKNAHLFDWDHEFYKDYDEEGKQIGPVKH